MTSNPPITTPLPFALRTLSFAVVATVTLAFAPVRADDTQAAIAVPTGTVVKTVHAVGAQIYECKPDGHAGLAWTFREPIATLIADGKTVGRHFAGPSWEMADGSLVMGKVIGKAPGASSGDIPWLKLTVSQHQGNGILGDVTTVQRIGTVDGNKAGLCPSEGALIAEPYSADYVFSRP